MPLPEVCPGTLGRDIRWRLPSGHRIHQMLRHPSYAGALVYGRTAAKTVMIDGRARQSQRQKKPLAQWRIRLLDNHPGYISWEDFLHIQTLLAANGNRPQDGAGGAANRGPAFLSGLLRCRRCGRKLTVAYSGTTGRVPRYVCRGGRVERGSSSCLTIGGLCVARAVEAAVLEALQPAGIHAALEALEQVVANRIYSVRRSPWPWRKPAMKPSGPVGNRISPSPKTAWWRVHEHSAGTKRCNG